MSNNTQYFAAQEADATAASLLKKSESFYNTMTANAYLKKLKQMYLAYHGVFDEESGNGGHDISFGGEQGELVNLPVNHFRNIADHMYTMITQNRPIMEARAINTDYKSLAQTYLANGILDYYMREKHLEDALKEAVKMSIVLGAGFIKLEWNATAGESVDVDDETGEFIFEGELEFSNLSPFDVVFDGTKDSWKQDWVLCRSTKNRFDLIAKYPELEEQIRACPSRIDKEKINFSTFTNDDTDDIFIYEFYHKRTEALPDGRYILFVSADAVLMDAPMPYRTLPVFRISPANVMGTPYGYSPLFDLYPIQKCINAEYSAIMTNHNAFAVQNIFVPTGANITVEALEGGLNVIRGEAKPEPLNPTETPAEVFKFLEMLIQSMETISGVNSVSRGNPEASLKSGNALALVQSMSLQFISGLQQSYVRLIEDVGTALISILKDFATTPKVVALVGKNNRPLLKEFTGEEISAINRVVVDVGNPLSRSIAGRVQMAEQMMQMGIIQNPNHYFQIMNTGRLDVAYEDEMDEMMSIRRENEFLMEGKPIIVSPLDKHSQHIQQHRSVLADPELRQDASLVKLVMDHIQEHLDALRNVDPALLGMIGEQQLPPPGMMPMDPNAPPPPEGEAPPPGESPLAPEPMPSGPEMAASVQAPGIPTPPAPFENAPVTADQLTF